MLYREVGQFKTSYAADQAIFPIRQDRIGLIILLLVAFVIIPLAANEYWLRTMLTPFLIYALAAIGLNLLTGYAGQVSLGTGAFMGVGAYAAYNISIWLPSFNIILGTGAGGTGRRRRWHPVRPTIVAHQGLLSRRRHAGGAVLPVLGVHPRAVGHPLQRQRHCYLSTTRAVRRSNHYASRTLRVHPVYRRGPCADRQEPCARNAGRSWMAIRDMDIAAEIIGIRPLRTKLLAFAVGSFYCGTAGALVAYVFLGSVEPAAFDLDRSFQILFMIIIGGLGSILGCFLGSAFITLLPIFLNRVPTALNFPLSTATISHIEFMTFGALIVFFLIVEPHGLARLWQIAKEKLRLWPFPY